MAEANHALMQSSTVIWVTFILVAGATLFIDMVVFDPKGKKVSDLKATLQALSLQGISLSVGIGIATLTHYGWQGATKYFEAYFSEWLLSIDNLFVMAAIINMMGIPRKYRQFALSVGILFSIFARIAFLWGGTNLVARFELMGALLGLALVWTAVSMLKQSIKPAGPTTAPGYALLERIPTTEQITGRWPLGKDKDGKIRLTKLWVVIGLLATACVVFAFDSIPVVIGITTDLFLVISSNVMAVSGQRSAYSLFEKLEERVSRLNQGVGIILLWVGTKMVITDETLFGLVGLRPIPVGDLVNFGVIIGILVVTVLVSRRWPLVIPEPIGTANEQSTAKPVAVELYIDTSGAMRDMWRQGRVAYYATQCLHAAGIYDSDQEVPVYQYAECLEPVGTVRIGEEFAPTRLVLGKESDLAQMLRHAKATAQAAEGKCVFIFLTNADGVDERTVREVFAGLPDNAFVLFVHVPGSESGLRLLRGLDDYNEGDHDRCELFVTDGNPSLGSGIITGKVKHRLNAWLALAA
jgi:tellurite resistance protein TerC